MLSIHRGSRVVISFSYINYHWRNKPLNFEEFCKCIRVLSRKVVKCQPLSRLATTVDWSDENKSAFPPSVRMSPVTDANVITYDNKDSR